MGFDRFAKYFQDVKTAVVYGGMPIAKDRDMLRDNCPHILIGTPGRVLGLLREKDLKLDKLTQFVLDECDKCLDKLDMRKDVQPIFIETPKKKQVMMFSATMSAESRSCCKKFMQDPHEIRVDEESKLTLHGLLQYYVTLEEKEKNRKLNDLLDTSSSRSSRSELWCQPICLDEESTLKGSTLSSTTTCLMTVILTCIELVARVVLAQRVLQSRLWLAMTMQVS